MTVTNSLAWTLIALGFLSCQKTPGGVYVDALEVAAPGALEGGRPSTAAGGMGTAAEDSSETGGRTGQARGGMSVLPASSGGRSSGPTPGRGGSSNISGSGGTEPAAAGGESFGGKPQTGGSDPGPSGDGGSGGADTQEPPEPLTFCGELTNVSRLAADTTWEYLKRAGTDCAVQLLYEQYASSEGRPVIYNRILNWTFPLWGCAGFPPPMSFDLVADETRLSQGDATRLIDHYVLAFETIIKLPEENSRKVRSMLEYLVAPKITDPSNAPSRPAECYVGDQ